VSIARGAEAAGIGCGHGIGCHITGVDLPQ
jgi:hypothetical protein